MLTAKGQEEGHRSRLELGGMIMSPSHSASANCWPRAKAFLRRRQPELRRYQFGDGRLDFTAHNFFERNREIALTTKGISAPRIFREADPVVRSPAIRFWMPFGA